MKASYSWLKEFVDLKSDPQKLAQQLTMAGLSVASLARVDNDWIYDIEVTSNRPDLLSMRGIAREVAAMTHGKLKKIVHRPSSIVHGKRKNKNNHRPSTMDHGPKFSITIEDKEGCLLYCGQLIKEVKVGPSPDWLKKRLEAVGLRCVNNVVDITNYCLMECGQPLHAFDFDKIQDASIVVRRAKDEERLILIDGSEKKLKPIVLVIADSKKPLAVAGIMGGRDSAVCERTVNILLESACFDPLIIRRGTRLLGVASDSSYRFERGVDIAGVREALDCATRLIVDLCGGIPVSLKASGKSTLPAQRRISFSPSKVQEVLCVKISPEAIQAILGPLGFKLQKKSKDVFIASTPSFRRDVKISEDLTEEIARIYGYDRIPLTTPSIKPFVLEVPRTQILEPQIKNILVASGLKEVITYSLISDEDYKKSAGALPGGSLVLDNPLSQDYGILRSTLVPSLLKTIAYNVNHNNKNLEIFEVSHIFVDKKEQISLGIALCGAKRSSWLKETKAYTLFDLKGILETLLTELQIENYEFKEVAAADLPMATEAAAVKVQGEIVASLCQIADAVKEAWEIKGKEDIFVAEVSLEALVRLAPLKKAWKPISSTPSIFRDVSVLADRSVSYAKINALIRQQAKDYFQSLSFVERYQGKEIPPSLTGLTFSIEYALGGKTLTDEEVNTVHQKVLERLINELGLKLR